MRIQLVMTAIFVLQGCSGDDNPGTPPLDAGVHDATALDAPSGDSSSPDSAGDSSLPDSADDAAPEDAGLEDAGGDAACPASWTIAPAVDSTIGVPDGGGGVLLHASATGTQDYSCVATAADGGTTYAWTFVGPEATLDDCHAALIGHHFASDAGATAPEWQTVDGTYVIGKKVAAFTPDGGASAIPWLLLQATSQGGTGTLGHTAYVQRVSTTGGVAPSSLCDVSTVGTTQKVPYGADYYFYGK